MDSRMPTLTEKHGTPIDPGHLALFEDYFATDFSEVRLHFSPTSDLGNRRLGSLAFTTAENIFFRSDVTSSPGCSFTQLLAHELTHVVQKRAGRTSQWALEAYTDELKLESEATAVETAFFTGKQLPQLSPDTSARPRMYGLAGHYYTAFYTAAAVGLDLATARQIALYTQLPDLISELDAVWAGEQWGLELLAGKGFGVGLFFASLSHNHFAEGWWSHEFDDSIDAMVRMWQVQAGLHALTGRNAQEETAFRESVLRNCRLDSQLKDEPVPLLRLGLAIHAFGDSFAHRDFDDGQNMYGPPGGHSAELANHILRGDFLRAQGTQFGLLDVIGFAATGGLVSNASEIYETLNPHDPDNLDLRFWLYQSYTEKLYEILSAKSPKVPPVGLDQFKGRILQVKQAQSTGQAAVLMDGVAALFPQMAPIFQPADKAVPWGTFLGQNSRLALDHQAKDVALTYAAEWCGSAEPFLVSIHGNFSALKNNISQRILRETYPERVLLERAGGVLDETFDRIIHARDSWINEMNGLYFHTVNSVTQERDSWIREMNGLYHDTATGITQERDSLVHGVERMYGSP